MNLEELLRKLKDLRNSVDELPHSGSAVDDIDNIIKDVQGVLNKLTSYSNLGREFQIEAVL